MITKQVPISNRKHPGHSRTPRPLPPGLCRSMGGLPYAVNKVLRVFVVRERKAFRRGPGVCRSGGGWLETRLRRASYHDCYNMNISCTPSLALCTVLSKGDVWVPCRLRCGFATGSTANYDEVRSSYGVLEGLVWTWLGAQNCGVTGPLCRAAALSFVGQLYDRSIVHIAINPKHV